MRHQSPPIPTTHHPVPAPQVDRKKIGFNEEAWEGNLELEAFLTQPAEMKEVIEKMPQVTGAQSFQLHYNLKKMCGANKPLPINLFPESISLRDRDRKSAMVDTVNICTAVKEARKEMISQLDKRFFTTPPSEARLVKIYMSKQLPASKVLPAEWL